MPPLKPEDRVQWRSLGDRDARPELEVWREGEFPGGLPAGGGPDRREFLKLMGASVALMGTARCRWPAEPILPFAHRPEGYVPGVPKLYATALELGGAATGVLVTSYDGRPVKIEGNPRHPYSLGATSALHQASVLDLYDPDRSRHPRQRQGEAQVRSSWEAFAAFARERFAKLAERAGRGLYVLAGASSSPTLARKRRKLLEQLPRARWLEYEPFSQDDAEREGTRLAFGTPLRAHPRFDRARVVLLLDADPWLSHPAAVRYIRDFTRARRSPPEARPRVWAVEAVHSLSGSLADHRLPLRFAEIPAFLLELAAQLFLELGLEPPAALAGVDLEPWRRAGSGGGFAARVARDLASARGACLLLAGPRLAPEVHAWVHVLNHALGASGRTVAYTEAPDPSRPTHAAALEEVAKRLEAGRVDTLLVLDANPVFDAPAELEFSRRLQKAKTAIHVGLYCDETGAACHWHLPRAHVLEAWSDARAWDGTWSIVQPLIEPLWAGRTPAEVLSLLLDEAPQRAYALVRETFREAFGEAGFEARWRRALHDGLVADSAWPEVRVRPVQGPWRERLLAAARTGASDGENDTWELLFTLDSKVYDGRFANNAWLQELPDPMTKLTWDNALLVAPRDARRLGIRDGDLVRVRAGERAVELPALVLPGQAPGSVAVALGYGRSAAGRVGSGAGVDVQPLRPAGGALAVRVALEPAGGRASLACTQDHWTMDRLGAAERELRARWFARQVDLREFVKNPRHAVHGDTEYHPVALWQEHAYPGHRWAMAIDLDRCVGCNACVVACQAENNVGVVGKREVLRGHEMHWIRVDRYFSGDPDAPAVHHQPVTCHHCENAPCESVCPVAATVHDSEGLNVMVYNRCIGTRYCSNNCPYKVRRFNWFNYTKRVDPVEAMRFNPEVSVRSRGVMEKCTFCLQRIQAARITARREGRRLRDGDVVPACAQACPAQAIVFGDLNDEQSRVRAWFEDVRAYTLLEEQNVKPRLRYLARLRHPAPESEG